MKTIELDDELFSFLLEDEISILSLEAEQSLKFWRERIKGDLSPQDIHNLAYDEKRVKLLCRFLDILKAAE